MISALEGTQPKPRVIVDKQSVGDIIRQIENKHKECAADYDKIAHFFDDSDLYSCCYSIWDFCKKNLKYDEESTKKQYTSCPYTILTDRIVDCKNYSLFTAGILDALKRKGYPLDWRFRFVSYEINTKAPGHVFVVVNENTDNIWIDCVLDQFNHHLFYWYKKDRMPIVLEAVGSIGRVPAQVGKGNEDALLTQKMIDYYYGVNDAINIGNQTKTVNSITQSVLQGADLSDPQIAAAMEAIQQGQAILNNAFGVGSQAARVFDDLAAFDINGLIDDLFNGRTFQFQIYWLAAMYQFYVLGQSSKNNQNKMTDGDVFPAVKWFMDRLGVYISGTEHLAALTQSADKYISYYGVNKNTTTDRSRVNAAVAVAQKYFSNAPINPGDDSRNFQPGTEGSWRKTIGVFDYGIAQIAASYGLTPFQYIAKTGVDYTQPIYQQPQTNGSMSSGIIPGVDNIFLYAGFAVVALYGLVND